MLRTATFLSTGCLLIPLTVSLCHVFTCVNGDVWLNTTIVCFDTVHLVLVACVSAVLTAFAAAAVVGT